jgi:hypothetical protein
MMNESCIRTKEGRETQERRLEKGGKETRTNFFVIESCYVPETHILLEEEDSKISGRMTQKATKFDTKKTAIGRVCL